MRRKHYLNKVRNINRFAILPITIKFETRWLEMCKIKQVYSYGGWYNDKFLN